MAMMITKLSLTSIALCEPRESLSTFLGPPGFIPEIMTFINGPLKRMSVPLDVMFGYGLYQVAFGLRSDEFPVFNWPLHELAKVYETMEGVTQNLSQSGLIFGDPLYNGINTFSLDGTNFVDINVGTHNFRDRDDYTFSFYMKMQINDPNNKCLLDYQSDNGSSGLMSMRITVSDDDMLITRTLDGSVTEQFSYDDKVTTQWQLFSVALDNSQGKVSICVLNADKTEISGWEKKQLFNTPGTLRVGGCFNSALPKFFGSITCLSLFKDKLSEPDLTIVDDACQKSTYVCHATTPDLTTILNSQTCPGTTPSPSLFPRYFNSARYVGNEITVVNYLMTENLVPDPNLQAFVAMYSNCSLFQCGSSCMMDDTCMSFSIEEISEGSGTCRIYNVKFSTGLVVLSQSAYYLRQ